MKILKYKAFRLLFVLLLFFLFLHNYAYSQTCSYDSVKTAMMSDWKRVKEYTLEYIQVMPERAMSFRPVADGRSFAENMLHGAQANFISAAQASGLQNPYPYNGRGLEQNDSLKSKDRLEKIMIESFDFMVMAIQQTKPEQLGERQIWYNRSLSKEKIFRTAFEHQVHMTAQCVVYLKLQGIKVPQEKIY